MRGTLLIVLAIIAFCNVKAPKPLLAIADDGKNEINIDLENIKFYTDSFSSGFYLNYSNLNEISII